MSLRPPRHLLAGADAARDRGAWKEAANLYQTVLMRQPNRADLHVQLGHCLKESGDHRGAYRSYRRALEISPDGDAYLHLGHLLKVTGNLYAARACYRTGANLGDSRAAAEWESAAEISAAHLAALPEQTAGSGRAQPVGEALRELCWCEQDFGNLERQRRAARLLIDIGLRGHAKALLELCFIRDGFSLGKQRLHKAIAAETGLWKRGGPFAADPGAGPVRYRGPELRDGVEEIAELIAADTSYEAAALDPDLFFQRHSLSLSASAPSAHLGIYAQMSDDPANLDERASRVPLAEELTHLISRLYNFLAGPCDAAAWASFRELTSEFGSRMFRAPALAGVDRELDLSALGKVADRILFNNLKDFLHKNYHLSIGPFASPQLFWQSARCEEPPFLPYFKRKNSVPINSLVRNLLEGNLPADPITGTPFAKRNPIDPLLPLILERIGNFFDYDKLRADKAERLIIVASQGLDTDALYELFAAVIAQGFTRAAAGLLDEIVYARMSHDSERLVTAAELLRQYVGAEAALRFIRPFDPAGGTDVEVAVEHGTLEAQCGHFDAAVSAFERAIKVAPVHPGAWSGLLDALPETSTIETVEPRLARNPLLRQLAEGRLLYRLHLDPWQTMGTSGLSGIEGLVPEIAPEFKDEPVHGNAPRQIDIVQTGWERRRTMQGTVPLLRGIVAIRARVVSAEPWMSMRVRVGGRTMDRVVPETGPVQERNRTCHWFNAWIDVSHVRAGLTELQLVFEAKNGTSEIRELPVWIEQMPSQARSCAIVPIQGAVAGASLEQRINRLPSAIYATRRSLLPRPPRQVLVVRADQLGDFVLSVPAIERLRHFLPEAALIALVSPVNLGLAEELGIFDRVIAAEFRHDPALDRRFMTLSDQAELRRELAAFDFDLAIDLSPGRDSRPLLRLSGAPVTVGFNPDEFPWLSFGIRAVSRDPINGKECIPHSAMIMTLVDALGTQLNHQSPRAWEGRADKALLHKYGIGAGDRYLLLHAGARLTLKKWPLAHYVDLARLAIREGDLKVVLMADEPAEAEEARQVGLPDDRFCAVGGRLPFADFDALVSYAAVVVANDTGPKHLAAFRGARVVSVHMGQVNWEEWGQEGDGLIVTRHVPCYGCGIVAASECGKALACLIHIRPEEVFGAVKRVLGASEPSGDAGGRMPPIAAEG